MVQLKSFKYIESENPQHSTSSSPSFNQENKQQQNSPEGSSPPSSIGGNLTVDRSTSGSRGSNDSYDNNIVDQPQLSSVEYQQARYELVEDDDQTEANEQGQDLKVTSNNQDQAARIQLNSPDSGITSNSDELPGKAARRALSMSPHAPLKSGQPRIPLIARQTLVDAKDHLKNGSSSPLSRPLTPKLGNPPKNSTTGGDELSQHSFGVRSGASANHFEVRWRNINLRARKSKLPKFVTDSPLYKLLRKPDNDVPEKMYYSPPVMRHNFPNLKVPTISEHLEMNSSSPSPLQDSNLGNLDEPSMGSEYRSILTNVSGSVFSGQLTAVLGPSGVGKTSLLNSLTGRNTLDGSGRVSLIGGASKRMSVVTVPQADILPEKLTALEDLQFTSRLKNPARGFDHKRNIEKIVRHLHMTKFLNTRIDKLSGGEARRLSIARELLNCPDIMILDEPTSGLDANTCKKIIIALRDIVEHSDNILDRPMSIIITIHQPQREVLNLFHRVYVMAIGGCAIYEGPPNEILPCLLENSSMGQICQPDQLNENPAIVAIEAASGEYGQDVIRELAFYHESQCYEDQLFAGSDIESSVGNPAGYSPMVSPRTLWKPRKSPISVSPRFELLHRARMNSINSQQESLSLGKTTPIMTRKPPNQLNRVSSFTSLSYASTWDADLPEPCSRLKVDKRLRRSVVMRSDLISHTITLMRRRWLLTTRDLFLMAVRLIGFLSIALGMLQIFSPALLEEEHVCPVYRSEVDDMQDYMESTRDRLLNLKTVLNQSNNTHLLFFYMVLCVITLSSALEGLLFPLKMRMFVREYKNGWYSPAAFTISQTLAEFPIDIIGPIITVLIVYPVCKQPESAYHWREIGYIVLLILTVLMCKCYAQVVGAFLMNSVENSVFISCVTIMPPSLLSGIAVRISQMSRPLQIISYGSFLRYTFEGLFMLRYGYGLCPCDNETVSGYPVIASSIPPHLESMTRGLLNYYKPATNNSLEANSTTTTTTTISPNSLVKLDEENNQNIIVNMLRLVSGASNMFVPNPSQLGDCSQYRSLYLMDMGISDNNLPAWVLILVSIYIIHQFITYFVVKTVIKLRIQ